MEIHDSIAGMVVDQQRLKRDIASKAEREPKDATHLGSCNGPLLHLKSYMES